MTESVARIPNVTLYLTALQTKILRAVLGSGRHGGFRLSSGGASLNFCMLVS